MTLIEHSLPGIEYPDDALSNTELLEELHSSGEIKLVNDKLIAERDDFYQYALEFFGLVDQEHAFKGFLPEKSGNPAKSLELFRDVLSELGEGSLVVLVREDSRNTSYPSGHEGDLTQLEFNIFEAYRDSADRFSLLASAADTEIRISDERLIALQNGVENDPKLVIKQKILVYSAKKN